MAAMSESQEVYLSLSSRHRTTNEGCVASFCVDMPRTIPHILPSSASSTPVSTIAVEVCEVTMTGLLNVAAGSIFIFRKKTGIENWVEEKYSYEKKYCKSVDDLLTHLNAVLPKPKLQLAWNEETGHVQVNYHMEFEEKSESDAAVLLVDTTLASKLGFTPPNLILMKKLFNIHTKSIF